MLSNAEIKRRVHSPEQFQVGDHIMFDPSHHRFRVIREELKDVVMEVQKVYEDDEITAEVVYDPNGRMIAERLTMQVFPGKFKYALQEDLPYQTMN